MNKKFIVAAAVVLLLGLAGGLEAQQRTRPAAGRERIRASLKDGDKAPDFKIHPLTKAGETGKEFVSLSDAVKDRPAAIVFSSFT